MLAVAAVIGFLLPAAAMHRHADIRQSAQPALHQSAQQIGVPAMARAEVIVVLQGCLRLLPDGLAHDGGHAAYNGRSLLIPAALAIYVLSLVDRADQQIAHSPGPPSCNGFRWRCRMTRYAITGARYAQGIQIIGDAGAGLTLLGC